MEALQVLKFGLKSDRLSFTEHLIIPDEALAGTHPTTKDRDLLADYLAD
jgi:hypothetical protein